MMVSTEPTVKQRARSQQQFLLTHSRKTSRYVEMCKLRASEATGSSVRQLRDVSVLLQRWLQSLQAETTEGWFLQVSSVNEPKSKSKWRVRFSDQCPDSSWQIHFGKMLLKVLKWLQRTVQNPPNSSFSVINVTEKQQILTFKGRNQQVLLQQWLRTKLVFCH